MTQDRAMESDRAGTREARRPRPGEGTLARVRAALADAPDHPSLLRLMLRALITEGQIDAATETAERMSRLPGQSDPLDLFTEAALETGSIKAARTVLSEAEAEGTLPPARSALLKARIALATGDLLAAQAILVLAIDTCPDNAALRALLAEVMVAAGTAADARVVLGHMGRAPVNPPPLDPTRNMA